MASLLRTPTSDYRGRLAPSPTGYLHVGHARTFWTAWQRARDFGGALVMRMEDLDAERSKQIYADAALEDLRWLGIRWQEGPDRGGPNAPYVQSKRKPLYLAAWRILLRRGLCTARARRPAVREARTARR
jgi:glutamyl-tRNA synthetase